MLPLTSHPVLQPFSLSLPAREERRGQRDKTLNISRTVDSHRESPRKASPTNRESSGSCNIMLCTLGEDATCREEQALEGDVVPRETEFVLQFLLNYKGQHYQSFVEEEKEGLFLGLRQSLRGHCGTHAVQQAAERMVRCIAVKLRSPCLSECHCQAWCHRLVIEESSSYCW